MKVRKELYPAIIVGTMLLFIALGLLLGFAPEHGGAGRGHSSLLLPLAVGLFGEIRWAI